jgi:hypothetical protein
MSRALIVSASGEDVVLLDPGHVDATTGEWYCCRFGNKIPSAAKGSYPFRAEVEKLYDTFVGFHVRSGPTVDAVDASIEDAYARALRGDLSAGPVFRQASRKSWRASALSYQWGAFASAGSGPRLSGGNSLWLSELRGTSRDEASHDRVVLDELVPCYAVMAAPVAGNNLDCEVRRAPATVAERPSRSRYAVGGPWRTASLTDRHTRPGTAHRRTMGGSQRNGELAHASRSTCRATWSSVSRRTPTSASACRSSARAPRRSRLWLPWRLSGFGTTGESRAPTGRSLRCRRHVRPCTRGRFGMIASLW